MILDFHNHIFPEKIAQNVINSVKRKEGFSPYGEGTVSGLREEMNFSGVKACVVLAVAVSPSLVETTNQWIVSQRSDHLIPVGSIHPLFQDYKSEIKRLKEAGVRGIKFHSIFQNIRPDDERAFPLFEEVVQQDMFIIFHSGPGLKSIPEEEVMATPERLRRVLDLFPKMRMVVAHFGGFQMIEDSKKYLLGRELYIDTSYPPGLCFQPQDRIIDLIQRHDPNRILFGTDTPFARQKEEVEYILRLPISEDLKEKIIWKNGWKLLGLSQSVKSS